MPFICNISVALVGHHRLESSQLRVTRVGRVMANNHLSSSRKFGAYGCDFAGTRDFRNFSG